MKKIRVLEKLPGELPTVKLMEISEKAMKEYFGGDYDTIHYTTDIAIMFPERDCREEMPFNFSVGMAFYGPALFTGLQFGEITSLSTVREEWLTTREFWSACRT